MANDMNYKSFFSNQKLAICVLAAGKGTRLQLPWPKTLCPLLGQTILDFVLDSLADLSTHLTKQINTAIVVGHLAEQVSQHIAITQKKYPQLLMESVLQEQQRGTADAVKSFLQKTAWGTHSDYTLIVCGDTPLLTAEIYLQLFEKMAQHPELDAIAATFKASDPQGYGRILHAYHESMDKGFRIIEEKDATLDEKKISEVNAALYLIKTKYLLHHLQNITPHNQAREFYLTDLFSFNRQVATIMFEDEENFLGVNDQAQLETVRKILQQRKIAELRAHGVFIPHSDNLVIDWHVSVGSGTKLHHGAMLMGATSVGKNCDIGPYSVIQNCTLTDDVVIHAYSHLLESMVASHAQVGPFARLRPGSQLDEKVKVGNFVEIKKSHLQTGAKVSHLSYVGDAFIGKESNIGCGFITCNYDGKNKHETHIGDHTFIGSDCQAVAPIQIGSQCFVAAGTTITENIPNHAFAIGRAKQVTKPDLAKKFLAK